MDCSTDQVQRTEELCSSNRAQFWWIAADSWQTPPKAETGSVAQEQARPLAEPSISRERATSEIALSLQTRPCAAMVRPLPATGEAGRFTMLEQPFSTGILLIPISPKAVTRWATSGRGQADMHSGAQSSMRLRWRQRTVHLPGILHRLALLELGLLVGE